MCAETLWNTIIASLSPSGEEMQTTTDLWFRSSSNGGSLYIDKAFENSPSSGLSMQRTISKNDFLFVHAYYDRWLSGEKGIRHEVSRKSRNTAYIFALIGKFEKA
jgi:hypothetical protein